MNSFAAVLLFLFTIAARLSSGTTTFELPTSAETSTTISSIATSITTPNSSLLTCDCKYVQEGCWIQTNASKVRHFWPDIVSHKDLAKEATAWQCDAETKTCAIERGNEVWKRYEAAFIGDGELPREAVPVCTKRTFSGQNRKTVSFGCGIHWRSTPRLSYEQQKTLCKQYNESECVYVSNTSFPADSDDPQEGSKDCSLRLRQTTRTCDCLYYDVEHDWMFTNKSVYVGVLGHLERPSTADLQRTLLAWNCSADETCTIDIKDRNNEYRKQFFGDKALSSTAVPVCTQHTFFKGSKAFGCMWGCSIAWDEPLTVASQKKYCESKRKAPDGISECVYLNEGRFQVGRDKDCPFSRTSKPTGTRPPPTTTTTTTLQPTTTAKANEISSSSPVQFLALLSATAAAWAL